MTDLKLNSQWAGTPGQSQFKGYRKFIHNRMFTLGVDESKAIRKAEALILVAKRLKAEGKEWSDESIRQAHVAAFGDAIEAAAAPATPKASTAALQTAMLRSPSKIAPDRQQAPEPTQEVPLDIRMSVDCAIEKAKASLKKSFNDKEFGVNQYQSLMDRYDVMKLGLADALADKEGDETVIHFTKFLDQSAVDGARAKGENGECRRLILQSARDAMSAAVKILQSKSIDEITVEQLRDAKGYYTRRPVSHITGQQISMQYAVNVVHAMTRFFKYAEENLNWQSPRFWDRVLKFKKNQKKNMETSVEKQRKIHKDHMTKEDVKYYWGLSNSSTIGQAIQGLAFWCAWTQIEMATFHKIEMYVDEDDGETYIDKTRSKTGAWGTWWIPAPIAEIVRKAIAQTSDDPTINPEGLAFLTSENFPLVHRGEPNDPDIAKTDWIGNYWWPKIQRSSTAYRDGRSHSFKWFRKSSSNRIQEITKSEIIGKAFLAQLTGDVVNKYTNPLIAASIEASKQMWEEMKDIYTPKKKSKAA